ncbi:LacI family DNA-binding transcriptional regulator [Herbiconiux daphne]|uniref:LacI family transcriptional regulator n=1 Tax=Herbiconiux daphne TaxID=2970914 RepID=A0ABT2H3W3_9MICO|nr:LacI family DNA-binding transcriptional regulator [Herbiconiux daphne]MCS5734625.1 LacI family transcriptional regulator [Herbiconiux daphne]
MVTIQDVAKAAGVSPMTVSHVINEHPHVKTATRQKVLVAISALDYRVNIAARNLRTGRTGTIGLAVPELDRPYYGHLAALITEAAAEHKLHVVVEQTGATRESELRALALSRNRLYDGLILATVGLGAADSDLLRVDHPVVILGERIFDGPVDHIALPNVDGAQTAVTHLIESGCRRIAILDAAAPEAPHPDDAAPGERAAEVNVSTLRHTGYRTALAAAGIAYDPALVTGVERFTMRGGAEAATRLVESGVPFDGVFCVTDTVAMGALRAFATLGIRVPADVKVIGFDDVPESEYLVPSLSSIAPDHDETARTAVRLLVDRIQHGATGRPAREVVSGYRLVARETTAG